MKAIRTLSIFFVVVLLALLSVDSQARADEVDVLDVLLTDNRCSPTKTTHCLQQITNFACAGGCPRTGYGWVHDANNPVRSRRWDVHMTHGIYLKALRNAVTLYPDRQLSYTNGGGRTLDAMVYDQLEMMLRDSQARFYDQNLNPLPLASVLTGRSVDPNKFYSVTWVSDGGYANAMGQADFGLWLISMARGWALLGKSERVPYYLALSEKAFRPFGIPQSSGGVRNDKMGHRCHQGLFCYWFHSGQWDPNPSEERKLKTVLNQHLHAVRDALIAHDVLAAWRDYGLQTNFGVVPLPAQFNTNHIGNLKEWGRGGLFQLLYARGNHVDHLAPPNLAEFMYDDTGSKDGAGPYRAKYRYILGEGPRDIRANSTCGYHYHVLDLFRGILQMIEDSQYLYNDPHLLDIRHTLLYGRQPGDWRTCEDSPTSVKNLPLPEFHFAGMASRLPFQVCEAAGTYRWPNVNATRDYFMDALNQCIW
jgi:hypothetical protein